MTFIELKILNSYTFILLNRWILGLFGLDLLELGKSNVSSIY